MLVRISLFALCLWLTAALPTTRALASEDEYRLGTQDRVQVTVFNEPSLSGDFQIDGEGRITLPLIGEVAVRGLTLREAEQAVADKLFPDYLLNPKVTIQVLNFRPFYILGEVKRPGSYAYASGLTVIQAVALAGGFTYRARKSEVTLVRGGVRSVVGPGASLLPGDIIEVGERFF